MPRFELLVGSDEFWERASGDIAAARERLLVQAMTFEGDSAGLAVAAAIEANGASDRRVLVDDYTRHVLNDTFLLFSRDPALQAEAEATWAMFERLVGSGVGVRVTNPVDGNPLRYPVRNHKKLLVMDDVAWIGGINFSDHNFAWHDKMLRIEDPKVAGWLAEQFEADWRGEPTFERAAFGDELEIASFDGANNVANSVALLEIFAGARKSLEVLSAYPTMPFTQAMARAAARGVPVSILTPRPNNKPLIRDYLFGTAPAVGIELGMIDRMTHVKAALVDGETLLLGSSNFDFVSYRLNSEYVAVIRDEGLVEEAERRLFAAARSEATPPAAHELGGWAPFKARLALMLADSALRQLRPGKRVGEWKRPGWSAAAVRAAALTSA